MTSGTPRASVLGIQIQHRLTQLGLSRREFARRANIGRQTLQDIIRDPDHRISSKTFAALDVGLKWQTGTAEAFHKGNMNARAITGRSIDERINGYLLQILQRLAEMDIDQLEREVILLEEESEETASDSETSRLINRQISKLVASLIANNDGGNGLRRDGITGSQKPPNSERGNEAPITAGD